MKISKNLRYAVALGMLTLTATHAPALLAAGNQNPNSKVEFRIKHHQRLNSLNFTYRLAEMKSPGVDKDSTPPANVTFDAYGRQFDLDLETNEHLLDNLPSSQKKRLKQSMQIYKGRINGVPGSWARVNRIGNRLSGAFWDGRELYLMDTSDNVSNNMDDGDPVSAKAKPYNLVYKLSDSQTTGSCALEKQAANSLADLVGELQTQAQALAQANKKLDVAIIADAEFTQTNSANPQAAVMARMNVVDGIYSEQVGVHLNISQIKALSSNGGMTSTNYSTLLDQFIAYNTASGFNNPGLAHLFTGRDLDGSTVGYAYIGVLCRKDVGVGLSQTRGTGIEGALTVAHEMGHNFGASHDNQSGSTCASTPGTYLMSPILNGSSQFSDCSLQQIAPKVASATCLTDYNPATPTADIRPIIQVSPINTTVNSTFTAKVEVRNDGNSAALGSNATITLPTGLVTSQTSSTLGQCQISAQTVNCNLGSLAANTSATVSLSIKAPAAAGTAQAKVQVAASNDGNIGNNTASFTVNTAATTPPTTSGLIYQYDFNTNNGGFVYLDDTFLATRQPDSASGSRPVNAGNGRLEVALGGLNDQVVKGMSGGWRRGFTLSKAQTVTISFEYRVDQTPHYESNEWSDALLALDGQLIGLNGGSFLSRVTGDGENGVALTSGNMRVSITRGPLQAGYHTITLGGYNNQKTSSRESTRVSFDNFKLVANP